MVASAGVQFFRVVPPDRSWAPSKHGGERDSVSPNGMRRGPRKALTMIWLARLAHAIPGTVYDQTLRRFVTGLASTPGWDSGKIMTNRSARAEVPLVFLRIPDDPRSRSRTLNISGRGPTADTRSTCPPQRRHRRASRQQPAGHIQRSTPLPVHGGEPDSAYRIDHSSPWHVHDMAISRTRAGIIAASAGSSLLRSARCASSPKRHHARRTRAILFSAAAHTASPQPTSRSVELGLLGGDSPTDPTARAHEPALPGPARTPHRISCTAAGHGEANRPHDRH